MKTILITISILFLTLMTGCTDATIASHNLSKASDQFEVFRRVVFYNGITDKYIMSIEGYCSIEKDNIDNQLEVIVKTGPGEYLKHYLGLADNISYFVEQIQSKRVSKGRYRVIFKPSVILPNIDFK